MAPSSNIRFKHPFRLLLFAGLFWIFLFPASAFADVTDLIVQAEKAVQGKDYVSAEMALSAAVEMEPENYRVMHSLAEVKIHLEKYAEAGELVDRILAIPLAKGRNVKVFTEGQSEPVEAELVDETVMAVDEHAAEDLGAASKYVRSTHQSKPVPHYRVYLKNSGETKLLAKSRTRLQFSGVPQAYHDLARALKDRIKKSAIAGMSANRDKEDMVEIKGGCFSMGSDQGDPDEQPVHEVCLSSFKMEKHEVTQRNFQSVMGFNPSQNIGADLPVDSLTWDEARSYCQKTGNRLPTEAEWEYAARAGTSTEFYWGNTIKGKEANFCDRSCELNIRIPEVDDGFKHSAPVGSFPPNPWGLFDMSGNVGEWVGDWMEEGYYRMSAKENPRGPNPDLDAVVSFSITQKVYRGGAWNQTPGEMRSANRRDSRYQLRAEGIGFRCAGDF